jgi:hypothetical protein
MADEGRSTWPGWIPLLFGLAAAGVSYRFSEHVSLGMLSMGIIFCVYQILEELRHKLDDLRHKLEELQNQIRLQQEP